MRHDYNIETVTSILLSDISVVSVEVCVQIPESALRGTRLKMTNCESVLNTMQWKFRRCFPEVIFRSRGPACASHVS